MRFWIGLFFVFVVSCVYAQDWRKMVADGENYYDIVAQAEKYYATHDRGKGSGYVQYMRWKHDMQSRTYPSGQLQNFNARAMRAYQGVRRTTTTTRSVHGYWEHLGPTDYSSSSAAGQGGIGRINRIDFHPSDPMEFWVGSAAGGLWKTEDGGTTWTTTQDALPQLGVSGTVYDQCDPTKLYALTGDGDAKHTRSIGVLKSTDGGAQWDTTGLNWGILDNVYGYKLAMHPANCNKLFAATTMGIYFTDDAGASWTKLHPAGTSDFEYCPSDTSIIYSVTLHSPPLFLRSTTSGMSWDTITHPMFPDTAYRAAIAVCPSADSIVYLMYGGGPAGMDGFFTSTDYGVTFSLTATSPNILGRSLDGDDSTSQAIRNNVMVVDPTDEDIIYVGGINCWKSTDAGTTWERKSYWDRLHQPYVHADFLDMQFNNGVLYVCNDGGVYKTSNGGDDWDELSAGLSVMQFYEIDVHDGEYNGGTQDNGTNGTSVTNPHTHHNLGGDGFGNAIHYGNTSISYLTSQNGIVRRQDGINAGINPDGLGDGDFWFAEVEMHVNDPDYVFMNSRDELYKGNGNAIEFTWDSMRTSLILDSTNTLTAFEQGVSDPDIMYASNGYEMIRSDNINAATPTWTDLTGLPFSSAFLEEIAIDPDDAGRVWVAFGGYSAMDKVYFSPDSGATWINETGSLPNVPVHCLIYQPGSNDGLYVGTDIGVFYRNDNIGDWIYFSNGLPPVIVKDFDGSGPHLYAGTFGRGLWRTEPYTPCPATLTLTPANDPSDPASTGVQIYHAIDTINSTRILSGGFGTDVEYNAGTNVTLLPGFRAPLGNKLVARLAGCPE